jgi:hypothetical protein
MKLFVIGCSFSEGSGLENANDKYSYSLANRLQIQNYNLAISGTSNDYIFRKTFELLENVIHKDDIIIIQWTHFIRFELMQKYKNINLYCNPPANLEVNSDKILINDCVDFENKNIEKSILNEIDKKNSKYIKEYIVNFLNEDYQYKKTKNYIKSLYSYLELNGYKHLHFFGWDDCIINEVLDNKKFINKSFGGYTKTLGTEHPDKNAHDIWSNVLYNKLEELKYMQKNLL